MEREVKQDDVILKASGTGRGMEVRIGKGSEKEREGKHFERVGPVEEPGGKEGKARKAKRKNERKEARKEGAGKKGQGKEKESRNKCCK